MTNPNDANSGDVVLAASGEGGAQEASPGSEPTTQQSADSQQELTPEQIARWQELEGRFKEQNVDPEQLLPEYTRSRQQLQEYQSQNEWYRQQLERQQQPQAQPNADPEAQLRARMDAAAQSFDMQTYHEANLQLVALQEQKIREQVDAQRRQDLEHWAANVQRANQGRELGNQFGVTEQQMAEFMQKVQSGDMEAIAKGASLHFGTYDDSRKRQQEERERQARLARLAGSGAESHASGPGRVSAYDTAKPSYNPFAITGFLTTDGQVSQKHKDRMREYLASVDPATVPDHHRHLLS